MTTLNVSGANVVGDTLAGDLMTKRQMKQTYHEQHTANYAVGSADSAKHFHTYGATASVDFALPAVQDHEQEVTDGSSHGYTVTFPTGDYVIYNGTMHGGGVQLVMTGAAYSHARVKCIYTRQSDGYRIWAVTSVINTVTFNH